MSTLLSPADAPPFAALLALFMGKLGSQALTAAVELGIPDRIGDAPARADAIAAAAGVDADALRRLLRALAAFGVFREVNDGEFEHNALSRALRRQAAPSIVATAAMVASPWHVGAWGRVADSIRTGKSGFELAFQTPIFEYLAGHGEAASIFVAAMAEIASLENPAIVEAYSFAEHHVVVDVGGGDGALLESALSRSDDARGVLFDVPPALAAAARRFEASGLSTRCDLVAGDFFERIPEGGDCYVMKHVLHDWDDPHAARILGRCREAAAPGARLVVVEHVLPPHGTSSFGVLLDLDMLVLTGGRERTRPEFEALLAENGFELERIVDTRAAVKVIVAQRVS